MQSHTSTELAQAIVDRAFAKVAKRYPQPVELPRETCPLCDGTGDRDDRELHIPQDDRTPCRLCKGAGKLRQLCSGCKGVATAVTYDEDGCCWDYCESCATDTDCLDGLDFVVAFALRTLP